MTSAGPRATAASQEPQNVSPAAGLRSFMIIWLGQLVSLTGSRLTGFAIGVWIYQTTGSATQFAMMTLAAILPGILLAPLAGTVVDRWDRRRLLIVSDAGAGVCTAILGLLIWMGWLEIWHVYVLVLLGSVFDSVQTPAFSASIPLLVGKKQLGRAAAMNQVSSATARIISPLLAGVLLGPIGLAGIVAVDLATFAVAMLTLMVARMPQPPRSAEAQKARSSLKSEVLAGWTYLRQRPGLMSMLILFAAVNFALGSLQVLVAPMVLSFASAEVLGAVMSVASAGLLVGSLAMSAWGGPRRRISGIFVPMVLQAFILMVGGLRPNVYLIGAAAFLFLASFPFVTASSSAIWQSKIPSDLLGRAFAVQRIVAWSSLPLSYLIAGPLADHVFEPLLAPGGALAGSVGEVIGVGPGRGIALLFTLLGVFQLVVLALAYSNPRLRHLDEEVPDVLPDS
jgi:DHA3 family macrolide efflux protein-like MFS transporter